MHCIPDPRMHGLNGYLEIIETIDWGLKQLGHEVSYAVNQAENNAVNIIFGAQVLPIDFIQTLPKDTVIYNFEQIRGAQTYQIRSEVQYFADKFEIWEYSQANLETWTRLGANNVKLVPVGYAPSLTRIPKNFPQEIDVLIYGLTGEKRLEAFHRLSQAGIKTIFLSGLYGQARDFLISQSKLVLNINLYDVTQIFEIARVSYLLANKKAVVATLDANTYVEDGISKAVKFTNINKIVDDCLHLLEDDKARELLEHSGFEIFQKRNIVTILEKALI